MSHKRVYARPRPSKTGVNALEDALWRNAGARDSAGVHPGYDFGSPAMGFAGHDGKVLRAGTSAGRLRLYTLW